jgi:hypothetical protein
MDNQPILQQTPGMFPSSQPSATPVLLIFVLILALGTIVFGILTVKFYDENQTTTKTLNSRVEAAAKAGEANQKKTDTLAFSIENESPFRAYDAPDLYGDFVVNFPKDWSSTVDEEQSNTQVSIALNPNFIVTENGQPDPVATRVMLIETPESQYMTEFTGAIQEGQLTQSNITVSGQSGFNLTGTFNNGPTVREVVIPVRDKVLVFTTENSQYATEFDQILAQCKIYP